MPGATDNVNVVSGAFTEVVAADSIGSVMHQRMKTGWGADGAYGDTSVANPLPVQIVADLAGSSVVTDNGVVAAGNTASALAAALLYGANGGAADPLVASRLIAWVFSGAQAVSERAAATGVITQVNVDQTVGGKVLVAARTDGRRRRIVVTQTTDKVVWICHTTMTAGQITSGEPLAPVIGAEKSFYIAGGLYATVAAADTSAIVSVREEVLA